MNTKDVEKLIALIENTDIMEVELQNKEAKIKILRNGSGQSRYNQ